MRIVVLGAGTVGTSIADLLCRNRHSITVVDDNAAHCRQINNDLDVRVVCGSASESSVLFQADVLGADLCLAVTGVDEVNMVAASMAKAMGARRSIARVYAPVFRDLSTFDYQRHFDIDRMLSLEHLSAMALARGIRNPGSLVIDHFARGQIEVQEILVGHNSRKLGVPLRDLGIPRNVRLGSINRDGQTKIAGAGDMLEADDRITLIGMRDDIDEVKNELQASSGGKLDVVIAGGGETGLHLARTLEDRRYSVTMLESEAERCEYLANHLKHVTVVHADATRRSVLEEERVGSADVFVACTGDDENNIMAGVEAREIGAKSIMAIVNRPDYANVVGKLGIDLAVSPRNVIARQVLGYLNTGNVIARTSLAGSNITVFEIEVVEGVQATEHVLANLALPEQCLIASVMRADYVTVPGADDRLKPGDSVVALVEDSVAGEMLALFNNNGR